MIEMQKRLASGQRRPHHHPTGDDGSAPPHSSTSRHMPQATKSVRPPSTRKHFLSRNPKCRISSLSLFPSARRNREPRAHRFVPNQSSNKPPQGCARRTGSSHNSAAITTDSEPPTRTLGDRHCGSRGRPREPQSLFGNMLLMVSRRCTMPPSCPHSRGTDPGSCPR